MTGDAGRSSLSPLLIRRATLLDGRCVDMRIADGVIRQLAEHLVPEPGERPLDARGGLLLPGLHDHHLHLYATAAAEASLRCGPPAVKDEAGLRTALQSHSTAPGEEIRGTGFHESVCAQLDRHWLDAVRADCPVRIQHRSGMMWVYNSRALAELQLDAAEPLPEGVERTEHGELTGRFFNLDAWLGARLSRQPRPPLSLRRLSQRLASFGITAVTDTGVNNGRAQWQCLQRAVEQEELLQRVLVMGKAELAGLAPAPPAGLQPGYPQSVRLQVGPVKLYLREVALPDWDDWTAQIAAAHRQQRAVAIHCVTRVELTYALAALREVGTMAGDRIEHASVADDHALATLAELGVTVVSQPHFVAERGVQYRQDVDPDDLPWLYRAASFLRAGVAFAAGSDAPYGGTDPWAAMRAAMERRTGDGVVMSAHEQLSPEQALALFGGTPLQPGSGVRPLRAGQIADLCLLDVDWRTLREDLAAHHVRLTLRGGEPIYRHPSIKPMRTDEVEP